MVELLREVLREGLGVTPREYVRLLDYTIEKQDRNLSLNEVEKQVMKTYEDSKIEVDKLRIHIKSLDSCGFN